MTIAMARFAGACSGLLLFSAMIVRGLAAGNSAEVVLTRALVGLAVGVVLGMIAGSIAARVVHEAALMRKSADSARPDAPVNGDSGATP